MSKADVIKYICCTFPQIMYVSSNFGFPNTQTDAFKNVSGNKSFLKSLFFIFHFKHTVF